MIPKIIHQIWLGDQSKRPDKLIQTWIDKNPSWQHKLWTDDNLPNLICKKQFDECPSLAGKADILRYQLLYEEGGFFIDADSECANSLDDCLVNNHCFCCWENETVRLGLMANGYLACEKNCLLMKIIMDQIEQFPNMDYHPLATWEITGPLLLSNTVYRTKYPITVYPSWYFIPRHYSGIEYGGHGKIYAKQYWGTTPHSGYEYGN
jgi:mannosyltransferase OCH1-like enzyme